MGTFNYTSNDVEYNQVGQSYYTATGDISEGNIGNDHNVAVDGLTIGIPLITSGNLALRAVSLTEWYIIGGQGIWVSES